MTIERVALDAVDDLVAAGEIVDAKTIIGSALARQFLRGAIGGRRSADRSSPVLLDEYDTWLRVERGLAPNSLAAYRRDLRRYAEYLRRHGPVGAGVGRRAVVRRLRRRAAQARRDDGPPAVRAVVDRTRRRRGPLVPPLLRRGRAARLATRARTSARPRVPQGIPKALSEAEVEALLGAVAGDGPRAARDRAILETLYAGGVRISELVGLDLDDVDLHDGLARVLGKGDKERVVPLGPHRTAKPVGDYLTHRSPRARRTAGTHASRAVPERPRRTTDPSGRVDDRARRGRSGRARRPAVPARAAPLVRHPHARPRAPTSGSSRSCSGTPACRRPRCTRGCRRNGCGRCTTRPTPGPRGARTGARAEAPGGRLGAWLTPPTRCCATSSRRSACASSSSWSGSATAPTPPSTSTRTSPIRARSPPSGARSRRSSGQLSETLTEIEDALGQVRRRHLRRVRVVPSARSPRRDSKRCRRRGSASTCASQRR